MLYVNQSNGELINKLRIIFNEVCCSRSSFNSYFVLRSKICCIDIGLYMSLVAQSFKYFLQQVLNKLPSYISLIVFPTTNVKLFAVNDSCLLIIHLQTSRVVVARNSIPMQPTTYFALSQTFLHHSCGCRVIFLTHKNS